MCLSLSYNDTSINFLFNKFHFYLLILGPNRGGGFGIAEIVDVITLNTKEAREYHEPDVVDNNIFFPMNWTFHLSCDRIQTSDCIFNPIQRAPPANQTYGIQLKRVTSPFRSPDVGPSFDILSITPPDGSVPVSTPINCGAKEVKNDWYYLFICKLAIFNCIIKKSPGFLHNFTIWPIIGLIRIFFASRHMPKY